mmetsp:Transcript_88981/g.170531  ORF Transcript_88981/g.170531 Transcript_88981/m.170531 type:complete len:280 (-) Transcript_88981:562-1401(-)
MLTGQHDRSEKSQQIAETASEGTAAMQNWITETPNVGLAETAETVAITETAAIAKIEVIGETAESVGTDVIEVIIVTAEIVIVESGIEAIEDTSGGIVAANSVTGAVTMVGIALSGAKVERKKMALVSAAQATALLVSIALKMMIATRRQRRLQKRCVKTAMRSKSGSAVGTEKTRRTTGMKSARREALPTAARKTNADYRRVQPTSKSERARLRVRRVPRKRPKRRPRRAPRRAPSRAPRRAPSQTQRKAKIKGLPTRPRLPTSPLPWILTWWTRSDL